MKKSEYSAAERRADAAIHIVGVSGAVAGAVWLVSRDRPLAEALVLGVYGAALVGVLGISALYNLTTGALKDRLRRLDHAMIFVMIAATYAPLVLLRLPHEVALPLGASVGGGCAAGVAVKLLFPRRYDRLAVLLYLGMGWAIVWAAEPLAASLGDLPFGLLVAGIGFYTVGVPFCLWERLPYHNALWHACVLAGAASHFATMAVEFR